ncbi:MULTISPECIES: DUF6318 family protein [Cellulomonas]|uniref:DUF6318 family protein n=1 Tax=Cellulomonas TaxID=1707 RepID=UPI0012FE674B|nr:MULTISPECIES: DUF6318 family protein [Cellulomonas]UJP39417.1 hypothetical protein F1D97_13925 [Cellulomonas palmilytica]
MPSPSPTAPPTPEAAQTTAVPPVPGTDPTTRPQRPAAFDGPADKESAGAIAEYYLHLFAYAAATHDLDEMKELTSSTCTYCNKLIDLIEQYEAEGVVTEGGAIRVDDIAVMDRSDTLFTATVTYTQAASREIGPGGDVVAEGSGGKRVHEIDVLKHEGSWVVTAWLSR